VKTKLTTSPLEAAGFIRDGGTVAFPTETVYGLGGAVFDTRAIAKIFAAKQRPPDNPLIIHIENTAQITELAVEVSDVARRLIDTFFPGPLTVVLRRSSRVPLIATAGLESVGIRQPRLAMAHEFLTACATPVAAPSANLSGRPSPTTWQAVAEDLDGRIDCILQGPPSEIGLESTVIDCTSDTPIVLRSGTISLDELRAVEPNVELYARDETSVSRSPGMRHRHYSPRGRVVLVDQDVETKLETRSAYIGMRKAPAEAEYSMHCTDIYQYAHALFEFFREADRRGIENIYCEAVTEEGLGLALMDRIRRAAAG